MNKPLVFSDFDGVFNTFVSRNKYNKHNDTFGHHRRGDVFDGRREYSVNWSAELVRKFNTAKDTYSFDVLWLSTWRSLLVTKVDKLIGTHSDGFIDWDADSGLPNRWSANVDAIVSDIRSTRKYAALLDTLRSNPRPFVWVDDEATVKYNPADFVGVLDVPHLVMATDENYGLLRSDLDTLTAFFDGLA
jgi:hypothetical protein